MKYYARIISYSAIAKINNRGVDLAIEGRFPEAEILFKEVSGENNAQGAACNNLGIIYEIFYDREMAFKMYSRACMLQPDNDKFRSNFLTFIDSSKVK